MHYTLDQLHEIFDEQGEEFVICDGPYTHDLSGQRYSPEFMSLFVATKGTVSFVSHGIQVSADPSNLQMFKYDPELHFGTFSEDYESIGIVFSKNFWQDHLMNGNNFTNLAILKPVLETSEAELRTVVEFIFSIHELIKEGISKTANVMKSLVHGLLDFVGNLYHRWALSFCSSLDALLFVRFSRRLFEHYHTHRDVLWYAEQEEMSAAGFTQHIKQAFGFSALTWIKGYTVLKLCSDLKETDKNIKELAIEYNFSDTSHLCKFFKNIVGMSPETYRTSGGLYPFVKSPVF